MKPFDIKRYIKLVMGSLALFILFNPFSTVYAQTAPSISQITDNRSSSANSQIPKYEKFEITFQVTTSAGNLQLPYDPSPPPGIDPSANPNYDGVSVDAVFTDPSGNTYQQPAFYYQEFDDQVKGNKEWFYPTGNFYWKVRFAPNMTGTWQYYLKVQDKDGSSQTQPQSFDVAASDNKGFIKVSPNDPRYFEYDDGAYFPALGYNMNWDHIAWDNPTLKNSQNFQIMGQNGIQLIRMWLSQWGIFTSAWNPWNSINPQQHSLYIPEAGMTSVNANTNDGSETAMALWSDYNPCMFIGFMKQAPAVKRNTTYRIQIRYKTYNLAGPRVAGQPYGFVAKVGGWLWGDDWQGVNQNCHDPGTGTVVTPHENQNTSGTAVPWRILEGSWSSGNSDFLPNFYLVAENVTQGSAYIDYVWIQEDLGNGNYGPNIVYHPWMSHHLYFEQRNSYAFDKVLELARQNNVYLRPVILEKNEPIFNRMQYDGTLNDASPSNNNFYGNWRQTTKSRWLQKAWWRYLQARWGYSTNIHSWELLNEGNPWNGLHYTQTDELGKYMHCEVFGVNVPDLSGDGSAHGDRCSDIFNHPNDHMVSTSNWHSFPKDKFWDNRDPTKEGYNYPNVDFADVHLYPGQVVDTAAETNLRSLSYGALQPGGAGKPVIRGEVGIGGSSSEVTQDTQGIWLHNFIWGQINHGGLIESYWYDQEHIYDKRGTFDHRGQFGTYYNFIKDVPLSNGHYEDIAATVGSSNLRAWGQKDAVNGNAHVWIQNKNHTWKNVVDGVAVSPETGGAVICGFDSFANQNLILETWDTYSGTKQIGTITPQNGCFTLSVTNLSTDTAFKIINPTAPTPTPTPGVSPTGTPHCQPLGDINCSGKVDILDLSALLSKFSSNDAKSDLNNSGKVDILDLSLLLSNFGKTQAGATPTPTQGVPTGIPPTPTPTPLLTPTPTPPYSSSLITNITVSTGKIYPVDTLVVGKKVYTDRDYAFSTISANYIGKEYIQTANSDKGVTASNYLSFTLSQGAAVFVAYDERATTLPAWLNDGTWTTTGEILGTTGVNLKLYQKEFPAGEVTLGGNSMSPMSGAGSNYSVVLVS